MRFANNEIQTTFFDVFCLLNPTLENGRPTKTFFRTRNGAKEIKCVFISRNPSVLNQYPPPNPPPFRPQAFTFTFEGQISKKKKDLRKAGKVCQNSKHFVQWLYN